MLSSLGADVNYLKLYYTKKSQFVAGNEAEKVNVAVGPRVSLLFFFWTPKSNINYVPRAFPNALKSLIFKIAKSVFQTLTLRSLPRLFLFKSLVKYQIGQLHTESLSRLLSWLSSRQAIMCLMTSSDTSSMRRKK